MVKLAYAMTDPAGAGIYMLTANMTGGILMGFMAHHIYIAAPWNLIMGIIRYNHILTVAFLFGTTSGSP